MKLSIKTIVCIVTFLFFIATKTFSQTVYVQETGKKYHMKNCTVAGTGKTGMTITEAKKAGYTACKVCKPDETGNKSNGKPKTTEKATSTEPKKTSTPSKSK